MSINNSTRRIIFLNDLNSPRIEQAIFILRDNADLSQADAVTEAQKIVNSYFEELHAPVFLKRKEKKWGKIYFSAAFLTIAAAVILASFFR